MYEHIIILNYLFVKPNRNIRLQYQRHLHLLITQNQYYTKKHYYLTHIFTYEQCYIITNQIHYCHII